MKNSILWGSALLIAGLVASSCNKSTEPADLPADTSSTLPTTPTGGGTTILPGKVTITSNPTGTTILDSATITITSSNKTGDTIVYTTSGVAPIASSDVYTRPFKITGTTTIKAAAVRDGKLGAVATLSVTINSKLAKPSFSTSRVDTFDAPVSVEIIPANSNIDTVYYTLGSAPGAPSRSSSRSSGTVRITQSSFLVARSFSGINQPSEPETTQVVLKVGKLSPSVKSGNMSNRFKLLFNVNSKDSGSGATVRITRNGTLPNCKSSEMQKNSDSIQVDSNQTIVAIGCRDGWTSSDTAKVTYKFKVGSVTTTPDSGVHASLPQVKFSSATPEAVFFYTTDSSLPAWNATTLAPSAKTLKWTSTDKPIDIKSSIWLRAVAVKKGWLTSDTMTSRFVYIGDSAMIDNFELSGLGSKYGEKGLSWFACQYQNGDGCDQDQKFLLDRTLPRLDTNAADYKSVLGFRAWRVQVSINKFAENFHAGYAGSSIRVPEEYPGNAYRLVFWAKFQDAGSSTVLNKLPFVVEMAVKANSQNNGGYSDGFHRKVLTVTNKWAQYEIDFTQFSSAGNGYENVSKQPDSTEKKDDIAWFYPDPSMPAIGLTGYQGAMGHNLFKPVWTWGVSKEETFSKGDITAFRFSIMQPMDSDAASAYTPAKIHNPHEPSFDKAQLDGLVKGIKGYLWIDNVRLVRKSVN